MVHKGSAKTENNRLQDSEITKGEKVSRMSIIPALLEGTLNGLHVHLSASTAAATAKSFQSCLTLCDPIDGSPPSSSVPGILQAGIPEWVAFPSPMHACMLSHLDCVQLCNPIDSSPPGSSVHGILQARVLEWAAISFFLFIYMGPQ